MRGRLVVLGSVVFLCACSTAPISFSGVVPPGTTDSYACLVQQLNLLEYTIESGNRETGFVRGRKQTSGLGTAIFLGKNYHDVLTATVFQNPNTGVTTLRVVAARVEESSFTLFGGNERGIKPSDSGQADANEVLAQCGAENIVSSGTPDGQA